MNPEMDRYVDLFLAESREHLDAAHEVQSRLAHSPPDATLWREFMRHVHSIKGMAAAMHVTSMVTLTHAAEELAERLAAGSAEDVPGYQSLIDESLVCLGGMLDSLESGREATSPLAEVLARALRGATGSPSTERARPLPDRPRPDPRAPASTLRHWRVELRWGPPDPAVQEAVVLLAELGRVARIVHASPPALDAGRLSGRLILVVAAEGPREALVARIAALPGSASVVVEPAPDPAPTPSPRRGSTGWLRVPAERLESLVESVLDLKREQARAAAALPHGAERARHHLQRAELRVRELCGTLMELRLVPFESVAERLRHAVHELARELGKQVRFELSGGHVRLDRGVLDALIDPLLQALRNAVDHGIEAPDERRRNGKDPRGTLRLGLEREGERVRISVVDDGRGMCPDLLRRAAVERGMFTAEDVAELTDDEALLLATLPRCSTREAADHVSGRGVGLDLVRGRVESLSGFIELDSRPGGGCELRLVVPLQRALIPVLLVRSGPGVFAIPVDAVVQCLDAEPAGRGSPTAAEGTVRLSERLHLGPATAGGGRPRLLVLRAEGRPPALLVDEVLGRRDVVVQPLRAPLSGLRAYTGAALLEDGAITLVLDPATCARGT